MVNRLNPKAFPPLNPLQPSAFSDNDYTVQQSIGMIAGKTNETVNAFNELNENVDSRITEVENTANAALENANTAIDKSNEAENLANESKAAAEKAQKAAEDAQAKAEEASSQANEKYEALNNKVTQEIEDRKSADTSLQSEIDRRFSSEENTRQEAVEQLRNDLNSEIQNRISGDSTLQHNIEASKTELQDQIISNDDDISELQNRADNFDDEIATLNASDAGQNQRLTAMETITSSLSGRMDSYDATQAAQDTQIAAIQQHNTQTDAEITALKSKDNQLTTSLNEEIVNRETGDDELRKLIEEAGTISSGQFDNVNERLTEIEANLTKEETARTEADSNLQKQVTGNKTEADSNIKELQTKTDTMNTKINELQGQYAALNTEVEGNTTEIDSLGSRVESLENGQNLYMPKTGGEFTGSVTVQAPVEDNNPATKLYVDEKMTGIPEPELGDYARLDGANFIGAVTVQPPTANTNPTTKQYVDAAIESKQDRLTLPLSPNQGGTGASNKYSIRNDVSSTGSTWQGIFKTNDNDPGYKSFVFSAYDGDTNYPIIRAGIKKDSDSDELQQIIYTNQHKPTPADIGAMPMGIELNNDADLNDYGLIANQGIYYRSGSSPNIKNRPIVSTTGFVLLVYPSSANGVTQFYQDNNSHFYVRRSVGAQTSWSEWEKVYTSADKPTAADVNAVPVTGGAFTGAITVQNPTANANPATKQYVDNQISVVNTAAAATQQSVNTKLPLAGGTMTGNINMNNHTIKNLTAPVDDGDAVNKGYLSEFLKTLGIEKVASNKNGTSTTDLKSVLPNYGDYTVDDFIPVITNITAFIIDDQSAGEGFSSYSYRPTSYTDGVLTITASDSFNGNISRWAFSAPYDIYLKK